jgi:hypothetical protein
MRLSYDQLKRRVQQLSDAGVNIRLFSQNDYYTFEVKDGSKTLGTGFRLKEAFIWFNGFEMGRESKKETI